MAEEDIERALERTLVQTGVLLLPFGQAELEPSVACIRREVDSPALYVDNGGLASADQRIDRNEFVDGQALRIGLSWDSQFKLDIPYRYVDQSVRRPTGFAAFDQQDGAGGGFGDISVGFAKTLLRADGNWWPDIVARLIWDTDSGETRTNGVALGGGFNELRGSLSVVKRQDPLAFVSGFSYEKTFEHDGVRPGDRFSLSVGAVLAVSPGTSLRASPAQSFIDKPQFDNDNVKGSDSVVATASFGAEQIHFAPVGRSSASQGCSRVCGRDDLAAPYALFEASTKAMEVPRTLITQDD